MFLWQAHKSLYKPTVHNSNVHKHYKVYIISLAGLEPNTVQQVVGLALEL